jgi:hypothetical protein
MSSITVAVIELILFLGGNKMKEKEITVVKVEPMKNPVIATLANDLDSLQKAVSIGADYQGLIEFVYLEDNVSILCNEEGKLIALEPNRRLGEDILCGVFYLVAEDKNGNLKSLTPAQQDKYLRMFWEPDVISNDDVGKTIFAKFIGV